MTHMTRPDGSHKDVCQACLRFINGGSTPFAVLIQGPWGSGKSWFMEHVLRPSLDADIRTGKIVYIHTSLHGAENPTSVFNDICIQALSPIKSHVSAGWLSTILRCVWSSILWFIKLCASALRLCKHLPARLEMISDIRSSVMGISEHALPLVTRNRKSIIVLDDFERSSIPFIDRTSIIERLLRLEDCRVFVVCDTTVLEQEDKEFRTLWEKFIGCTYSPEPQYIDIVKTIANQVHNPLTKVLITGAADRIKTCLVRADSTNLRSLIMALRLYEFVDDVILNHVEPHNIPALSERRLGTLLRILGVVNEERVYGTDPHTTYNRMTTRSVNVHRDAPKESENDRDVKDIYVHTGFDFADHLYDFIPDYVASGHLNHAAIKHMCDFELGLHLTEVERLTRGISHAEFVVLEQMEFKRAVEALLILLDSGTVTSVNDFINAAMALILLEETGVLPSDIRPIETRLSVAAGKTKFEFTDDFFKAVRSGRYDARSKAGVKASEIVRDRLLDIHEENVKQTTELLIRGGISAFSASIATHDFSLRPVDFLAQFTPHDFIEQYALLNNGEKSNVNDCVHAYCAGLRMAHTIARCEAWYDEVAMACLQSAEAEIAKGNTVSAYLYKQLAEDLNRDS
jgi:hypothetical protein